MEEHLHAGKGWVLLAFGILLILNAIFYVVSWIIFAGVLVIIAAVYMISASHCCKNKKKKR